MKRTAVLTGPHFREHDPGPGHPESPARIFAVEQALTDWQGPRLEEMPPRAATENEILGVHRPEVHARIRATADAEHSRIDADTATSARSFEVAKLAAGGLLELVDRIGEGSLRNGFACVRPPGHHATAEQSMGFCLFNNVAIAARHLRQRYERVAIVDFDVHHGNGTEAIFYDDPSVLYLSLHQYPFYPGTGAASDLGREAGLGFNVNIPFTAGTGDAAYDLVFAELLVPILRTFAPEFVLVSAGFDAHHQDPLGGLQVTDQGYGNMMDQLMRIAEEYAGGRLAAVLEGGYDLDALQSSFTSVLESLTRPTPGRQAGAGKTAALNALREILEPHWDFEGPRR
jgi:acetoin utilization deacetylase AcuC-like enzyme